MAVEQANEVDRFLSHDMHSLRSIAYHAPTPPLRYRDKPATYWDVIRILEAKN